MIKLNIGETMIKQINIEAVYDCLDTSALLLYETFKTPYLKGIVLVCGLIISGEMDMEIEGPIRSQIQTLIDEIETISFAKEEIRKAMQLCILKGLKHRKENNQEMTPDTIGIFVTYLLNKFYETKDKIVLFDPIVGTGNLLTTIANQIEVPVHLVGVEVDQLRYEISLAMFDMLNYGDDVYLQDTLTFWNLSADTIVCDFSYEEQSGDYYFPYEVIKHHHANLKPGGYFICVIYNDFFENELSDSFRKELLELYDILGLIKLPDSLFKDLGKSILLLQKIDPKKKVSEKQFLLADIPSFEDQEAFAVAIKKINHWFEHRKKRLGE